MKRALTYLLMQNLSLGEYDSSKRPERQYSYQSNVTREPMFIMWWLLFVHKKAASIPNVQMHSYHNHALYHAFSYTSMHAYADLEI
jgi:hypothetical protein